jgi:hypothetical protein
MRVCRTVSSTVFAAVLACMNNARASLRRESNGQYLACIDEIAVP